VRKPRSGHVLVRCDAIDIGRHVRPASAELAYLDPPFGVGTSFGARESSGGWRAKSSAAYQDRWPSMQAYLMWLEPRVAAVRECLSSEGTMWLHLDHRAVHEAKSVCDRVFGARAFLGEVVWAPGNGARGGKNRPSVTHQTLLIYAKGKSFIWNGDDPILREPFAATSLHMHFRRVDTDGRRYRERTLGGRTYRYYADEGRALGSLWTDCPSMVANTPLLRETTGYPTQKPLKLLERIVRASSRKAGVVVDPFCGSATTMVAASRLDRVCVGGDIGAPAIEHASRRLRAEGAIFELRIDCPTCPPPKSLSSGRSS
jgi:site-specific DNA-methyltransferase (adenine-specific)